MTTYKLSLQPVSQNFKTVLGSITYTCSLNWSDTNDAWVLDLADGSGNSILSGLIVVAGTDLLEPYEYLNFGGALVAITSGDVTQPPTFQTLGTASNLYFITP